MTTKIKALWAILALAAVAVCIELYAGAPNLASFYDHEKAQTESARH